MPEPHPTSRSTPDEPRPTAPPPDQTRTFTELPPLALYIHLPWCVRKCPYCDFNSHEPRGEIPESAYVAALLADLEQELPDIWGRSISSVFIGGGTPSLFSADALERLFSGLRALLALSPTIEITLEANPGTVEQGRFTDYRAIGINRLSIGVQSFDDRSLQALGRIHSAAEASRAVDVARQAGFDNLNLDLMFGLPGQSRAMAREDLQSAIGLAPEHLSRYELTLEPNTLFARFPPDRPGDDMLWQMQRDGEAQLSAAGYRRYEISAFTRPGRECEHNRNYWEFGDYLGIGAGAHGKLSFADTGLILRRWKRKHPTAYLDKAGEASRIGGQSVIAIEETGLEFFMNALRLVDGVPMPLFQAHTGIDLQRWQPAIATAEADGLLEQQGLRLKATDRGLQFLNDLLGHFLDTPTEHRYPMMELHLAAPTPRDDPAP